MKTDNTKVRNLLGKIEAKRYMNGNIVSYNGNLCRVIGSEEEYLYVKYIDDGTETTVLETTVQNIPLNDKFFVDNGYGISDVYEEGTRKIQHIIPFDGFGPAITKYADETVNGAHEYCIAGIIIRTVDDFQNLMNICKCYSISDKIKVEF